jgi:hypothetical protein
VTSVLSSGSAIFCVSCNIFHPQALVNAFRKPCQLLSADGPVEARQATGRPALVFNFFGGERGEAVRVGGEIKAE